VLNATVVAIMLALSGGGVGHAGQPDSARTEVGWTPTPSQGSIVHLSVRPAERRWDGPVLLVRGSLAEQPLHFEPDAEGRFHALAGIPVSAPDSMRLSITVRRATGSLEQFILRLPVARARFSIAQLRVDPRFVNRPDSALAARIAVEREMVRRATERSHETPRVWGSSFTRPRRSEVTSPFGQRREFNGELRSRHLGVDLAGSQGTPVVASNRGVVVLARDFYYAGNAVYLDHGRGLVTAYMHLSEMLVAPGDTVERGQVIGRVGATGRVTGPHLHWVAKYGRITVNPFYLLDLDVSPWTVSDGNGR
jgi:murein DD-endopeptidase MepM/ murein hydrolase activator NlpD